MKKVIVFGTFDIFHEGHRNFFKQAKEFGDFLIVVVARDGNVLKIKGVLPWNDEESRLAEIKKSGLVDKVILGNKNKVVAKKSALINEINSENKNEKIGEQIFKDVVGSGSKNSTYKYLVLQQEKPDVVCLGYDQRVDLNELQKMLKKYKLNKTKIIKLKAYKPKKYKSSLLKNNLK
jgi:cytidyltransferase-like protein